MHVWYIDDDVSNCISADDLGAMYKSLSDLGKKARVDFSDEIAGIEQQIEERTPYDESDRDTYECPTCVFVREPATTDADVRSMFGTPRDDG